MCLLEFNPQLCKIDQFRQRICHVLRTFIAYITIPIKIIINAYYQKNIHIYQVVAFKTIILKINS